MGIRIVRRATPPCALLEVLLPRGGSLAIATADQFLGAMALREPFALEIVATAASSRFLVRAASAVARDQLAEQLGAAYPQAEVVPQPISEESNPDPARRQASEQVAACTLVLRGPDYLPLRTFDDKPGAEVFADPLVGVLAALSALPPGWRALTQLLLRPAAEDWGRDLLPLALEPPPRPPLAAAGPSAGDALRPVVFLGTGLAGLQGYFWYQAGDWGALGLAGAGILAAAAGLASVRRRWPRTRLVDPRLVSAKLAGGGYRAELRLAVFAPADVPRPLVEQRLAQAAAAYRQYSHAAGNALFPRRLRIRGDEVLADVRPFGPGNVLSVRELAGLWHLPLQGDLPGVSRTTARRQTPPAAAVTSGCPLGVSLWQGRRVPVALPTELVRRHLLLVAKTRRGKSTMLLRLARYVMEGHGALGRRPALVLIDPHRDLAHAALGLVPPERADDLVFLEVGQTAHPFGLNLLDVGLGWERDRAVEQALDIFRRQWEHYWGPRMESAFRFGLQTLLAANSTLCARDNAGRARQFTILDVSPLLSDTVFRRSVLPLADDPVIRAWWGTEFDPLDRRFQLEIVNPVQTKIARYAGSTAARLIVGQPQSTIDPAAWLREGRIVVVNTARGTVGEDTAGLIGSTLLNLVAHAVSAQADLPPGQRRPIVVIADEFHLNVGADYEGFLGELAKFGASLILATQSLARLEALEGAERRRALRALLFANLDGLFAFHCSAEDARYLLPELGSELEIDDLVSLGEHQCYARLSAGGERLPVFSMHLDPPLLGDAVRGQHLAHLSAQRYGRPRAQVEADLAAALERVAAGHAKQVMAANSQQDGPPKTGQKDGGKRNEGRASTATKVGPPQDRLPMGGVAAEPPAPDGPEPGDATDA